MLPPLTGSVVVLQAPAAGRLKGDALVASELRLSLALALLSDRRLQSLDELEAGLRRDIRAPF